MLHTLDSLTRAGEALAQSAGGPSPGADTVRETVEAYADTIVPGPAGGADPAPGAVEAGAVEEVYDPFYGLRDSFPALHADIQAATKRIVGPTAEFDLGLSYPDRERVVLDRIEPSGRGGDSPLYVGYAAVAIVVWFAYYGTAESRKGVDYIGFPPHSDGYFPDHTYAIRFRGMTADGNPD